MPQIFMVIAPSAKDTMTQDVLDDLVPKLVEGVEDVFGLRGKNDVVFTAVHAAYVKGDAALQLEIRYTAGRDEYHTGQIFDPSRKQQEALAEYLAGVVGGRLGTRGISLSSISVWVIPYRGTFFRYWGIT